jgi:hypothetical protein
LKKFIDEYKEQPKFSVSWMTRLTHNDINGLVPADKDYYEFFKEYMDKVCIYRIFSKITLLSEITPSSLRGGGCYSTPL